MQTFINFSWSKERVKILAISYLDKHGNVSTPYDDVGMECFVMLNNWPHICGGGLMFYGG